jgi:hypothetical protein
MTHSKKGEDSGAWRFVRELPWIAAILVIGLLSLAAAGAMAGPPEGKGNGGGGGGGGGGSEPPASPEIAYVGANSLYVMSADGTNPTRILRTRQQKSVLGPAWSPDGTRIVFWGDFEGPAGLYVVDADGANLQRIHTVESEWPEPLPDWSPTATPDGFERIVFVDKAPSSGVPEIFVIDPDGSNLRQLTDAAASGAEQEWVCWTRDARGLLRTNGFGRLELLDLGVDGDGQLVITRETLLYEGGLIAAYPASAHRNDWVAVSEFVGDHYRLVLLDISDPAAPFVRNVIDTGRTHLGPSFSPDDTELVSFAWASPDDGIYRHGVLGGGAVKIMDKAFQPDWRAP